MATFPIPNIKIAGISACAPSKAESNYDYNWITKQEQNLLIKTTGIEEKRIATKGTTTSDLCYTAALKLIEELEWNKDDIELLIFVSQSRDYILPATAIILQDRLNLPKTTIAFDISLGCSGYVYGLSAITSFMSSAKIKKGLLLVGDISSLSPNKKDKSTAPLFGDAGTATALTYNENSDSLNFSLQSDGSGSNAIIIPDGGVRNPITDESFIEKEIEKGIWRTNRNLSLDGLEVFNFSISMIPPHLKELLAATNYKVENIDYFVFHQANKLILETIRKKMKIEESKVPYSLLKYGNTSSASIPLTIVSELNEIVENKKLTFLLCGFGVGLSWGSLILELDNIVCPKLIEYS